MPVLKMELARDVANKINEFAEEIEPRIPKRGAFVTDTKYTPILVKKHILGHPHRYTFTSDAEKLRSSILNLRSLRTS